LHSFVALSFVGVAHAQDTMDFSGTTTFMTTFKTLIVTAAAIRTILLVAVFAGEHVTRLTRTTDNAVAVSQTVDLWVA